MKLGLDSIKMNGLSWYRIQGVFFHLKKLVPGLEIESLKGNEGWHDVMQYDAFYFSRSQGDNSLEAIRNLKKLKKIIWLDYDDDIFTVKAQHPSAKVFNNLQLQNSVKEILKLANVVTVTTEHLKTKLLPFNSNIIVIPNSHNDIIFNFKKNHIRTTDLLWRGSQFHNYDLYPYKPQVSRLIESNSNKWVFVGENPWFYMRDDDGSEANTTFNSKIIHIPAVEVTKYLFDLHAYSPMMVHVPLAFAEFNLSKSNIAILEAAISGTTAIVPNTPEWLLSGALNYSNNEEYESLLQQVINGEIDIDKNYQLLIEDIMDRFCLSKNNLLRAEILKNF